MFFSGHFEWSCLWWGHWTLLKGLFSVVRHCLKATIETLALCEDCSIIVVLREDQMKSIILSWTSFWVEPLFELSLILSWASFLTPPFFSWTLFLFHVRQTFSLFLSQLSFTPVSLLAHGGCHTSGPCFCCFRLDYSWFSCLRPNTLSLCK